MLRARHAVPAQRTQVVWRAVLWLFAALILLGRPVMAEELVFGVIDLPPYALPTPPDAPAAGLYPDIIREIADEAGLTPRIKVVPLSRILADLDIGVLDVTINLENEALAAKHIAVHRILPLENVAIPQRGFVLTSFDQLNGKTVIQVRGGHYDLRIRPETAEQSGITLYEMSRSNLLPQFVKAGRADAMVGTLLGLKYSIREVGYAPDDFGAPLALNTRFSMLYLSRRVRAGSGQVEALRVRLYNAVSGLIARGRIDEIYRRYASE